MKLWYHEIVVSLVHQICYGFINLLRANACLLISISSPLYLKENYLLNKEATIENLFWKIWS